MITEEKKLKQTAELTKAVLKLSERFKKAEDRAKKMDGKTGLLGNIGKGIAGAASKKMNDIFSLKGIGNMMGLGEGTIIGDALAARHDAKEVKKAEQVKATKFAENFTKYSKEGKGLSEESRNKALARGVELFKEQEEILKKIKKIEDEIAEADELGQGDLVRGAKKGELDTLKARKKNLFDEPAVQPVTVSKFKPLTQEEASMMASRMMSSGNLVGNAITQLESEHGPLDRASKNDLASGIKKGMIEELLKSNEEQVEQLRKLVASSQQTEEERLESKIKAAPGMPGQKVDENGRTKDSGKGAMGSILDILKGMGGGIGSLLQLIPGVRGIMSIVSGIGTALSIGKSVVGGAGKLITGAVGLGTGLISKATGLFEGGEKAIESTAKGTGTTVKAGEKVAEKSLGKAGAKGLGKSLLKKLPGIGLLAGIGFAASRLMDGDIVGAGMEAASGALSVVPGIGTAASVGVDAALAARDSGVFDSDIEKAEQTTREMQTAAVEKGKQTQQEIAAREKAGGSNTSTPASTSTVINNVNNSKTTVSQIRPPTRNAEPTFNNRLTFG